VGQINFVFVKWNCEHTCHFSPSTVSVCSKQMGHSDFSRFLRSKESMRIIISIQYTSAFGVFILPESDSLDT
jgi:hypothetical protein